MRYSRGELSALTLAHVQVIYEHTHPWLYGSAAVIVSRVIYGSTPERVWCVCAGCPRATEEGVRGAPQEEGVRGAPREAAVWRDPRDLGVSGGLSRDRCVERPARLGCVGGDSLEAGVRGAPCDSDVCMGSPARFGCVHGVSLSKQVCGVIASVGITECCCICEHSRRNTLANISALNCQRQLRCCICERDLRLLLYRYTDLQTVIIV